jgi:hypothetical protein
MTMRRLSFARFQLALPLKDTTWRAGIGGVLLLAPLLAGCGPGYDEVVEIYAPLHRLELPEKPHRRFSAGLAAAGESAKVILTDSQSQSAPDPVNPAIGNGGFVAPIVLLEAYPLSWLSVAYEYADYGGDIERETIRAKAHVLGPEPGRARPGDFSLAVTYGYADTGYQHNGLDGKTSLDSETSDIALVAGWRPTTWLLIYGGPYHHAQDYRGEYRNSNPPGGGGPVAAPLYGDFELDGYNLGLSFNPGIRWMSLIAEYSRANVQAGNNDARAESFNAAIRFNFGWRIASAHVK